MVRYLFLTLLVGCAGGDEGTSDADASGDDDDDDDGTDDTANPPTDPGPNPTTTGSSEGCVLLYGGNDRIRGPDEGLPLDDDGRTIQAWIRTTNHQEQIAISYGRPSPDQGFMLGTLDGYVIARAGSGNALVQGDISVADDEWHHIAAAYDGRLTVLTVDGEVAGSGEIPVLTLEGDVVAGNTPTGDLTKPWIGWLDDVRVFSGPRNPNDIAADPDGLTVEPTSLELWWDFDFDVEREGLGIVVPDLSGNGRDGITGGSPSTPLFPLCR